jgi:hypothetical protein
MAGFRKATPEQAALKMAVYGPPGAGKTFTALLIAEGLAQTIGKRVAVIDTERGTDFYVQHVAERQAHPAAFDVDCLYTKSITEVTAAVRELDAATHGIIIVDSVSHLWDSVMASYTGKRTSLGGIPLEAWTRLKRPYLDLVGWLINCPYHVLLCGRQTGQYEDDEDGKLRAVGVKMRSEKETPYEAHVCVRMECVYEKNKAKKNVGIGVPTAFVEKDRSGILQGKVYPWPSFATIALPLLPLLGNVQGQVDSDEDAGARDAEVLAQQDRAKEVQSAKTCEEFKARLVLAKSLSAVEDVGKTITPALKKTMLTAHVNELRDAYHAARQRVKETNGSPPADASLVNTLKRSIAEKTGSARDLTYGD